MRNYNIDILREDRRMYVVTFGLILLPLVLMLSACFDSSDKNDSQTPWGHKEHPYSLGLSKREFKEVLGLIQQQAQALKPTGNPDSDFVALMSIYHSATVKLCKIELEAGKDIGLLAKARQLIYDLEEEIGELNNLKPAKNVKSDSVFLLHNHLLAGADSLPMNQSMDAAFVEAVIYNHEKEIQIAKTYQRVGGQEQIKKIASHMINTQQQDLVVLRNWQRSKNK